jgi:hypothetical protein
VNHDSGTFVGIDTSKLRNASRSRKRVVAGTFAISVRSTPGQRRRVSSSPNLRPNTVK